MRNRQIIKTIAFALAVITFSAPAFGCTKKPSEQPASVVIDIDAPETTEVVRVTRAPEVTPETTPGHTDTEPPEHTPEPTQELTFPSIISKSGEFKRYDGTNAMRVDDRAYEICVYLEDVASQYAGLIEEAADALKGRTNVYDLIIPMSYGVMMPDDMRGKISYYIDMRACIDKTYSFMDDVKTVSVFDTMMTHRTEFIYFRTDHHWTALGAYYAYCEFMNKKGVTPYPLRDHREVAYGDFLGSLYKDSSSDPALLPAETVYAYFPVSPDVKMVIHSASGSTYEWPIVTDVTNYSQSAKYDVFAGEDNPLTVFTNPAVTDGSVLIIVKESFGNAMMAYLCDHYSTVYEIDYRYWKGNVVDFAKEVNATDLLFANNFMMISSSSNVGKLSMIVH